MSYTILLILCPILIIFLYFFKKPIFNGIIYGYPDIKDQSRFNKNIVNKGGNEFVFNVLENKKDYSTFLVYDDWKYENALKKTIRELSVEHNSNAFILIKDDTVLYEEYFNEYNSNTKFPSYSIAKSILSVLVGIALDEGYIKDLNQPITLLIPELNSKKGYDKIKLIHLLNHTSGIKPSRLVDAYLYYGNSFWKAVKKVKLIKKPGTHQEYQNINAQLLGFALTRAVGCSLSKYLEEKVWKEIGATSNAFWNVFPNEKIEKSFCCFSATAIDYAKFGRLILNNGKWNNKSLVSKKWLDSIILRDQSEGSSRSYNKSWYLGLKKYDDLMAIGLYKQFVYVSKSDNVVIIRLGNREKKLHEEKARWPRVFRETIDQLE